MDKLDKVFIDLNEEYRANLEKKQVNNIVFLEWLPCFDRNFNKFMLYSSTNKNDLLYLTTLITTEYITYNKFDTRFEIDLGGKNVKYYRLATIFNNITNYSNIIEVTRGQNL